MGLDMYLRARIYISNWDHKPKEARDMCAGVLLAVGLSPDILTQGSPHLWVAPCIGYWRKANAIHAWFVDNCQDGKDECQRTPVTREQLQALKDECVKSLADRENTTLKPRSGFFFGSTEMDECYWQDLKDTIDIVDKALAMPETWDFEYQSSW